MGMFKRAKESMAQAQDAMQQAGGMQQATGGMAGMAMPNAGEMQAQAAMAQKLNRLGQVGIEAPGTVKAAMAIGSPDISGGTMHTIDVTIQPPGGEPYDGTTQQSLLANAAGALTPGVACVVKYDPADPSSFMVYSW